jgi:hypothetical protein
MQSPPNSVSVCKDIGAQVAGAETLLWITPSPMEGTTTHFSKLLMLRSRNVLARCSQTQVNEAQYDARLHCVG